MTNGTYEYLWRRKLFCDVQSERRPSSFVPVNVVDQSTVNKALPTYVSCYSSKSFLAIRLKDLHNQWIGYSKAGQKVRSAIHRLGKTAYAGRSIACSSQPNKEVDNAHLSLESGYATIRYQIRRSFSAHILSITK